MENSPQDYDIPVITMASEAPDHANDALARYFRAALKRLDYVEHGDPRDFILRKGTRDESHTPLSKVWVPAIVRNEASANADDTVEKMLDDGNTARLVLSEPGGGKSTLARYIVCKALRNALAQEGQRFGVFVPISRYRTEKPYRRAIAECAAEFVELGGDAEVVQALEQNLDNAIVVFDGLDEAPTRRDQANDKLAALRKDVASHINTLRVDPERPNPDPESLVKVQFVVTCRADDYGKDPCLIQAVTYRLTEFSPAQMSEAVTKWHAAAKEIATANGEAQLAIEMDARAISIEDALRENPDSLCRICRNPLMLATLQIVYQQNDELPGSVSQLCDKAIGWLLVEKPVSTGNAFVEEHSDWILRAIALLGHRVQERVVASNDLSPIEEDVLREVCRITCPIEEDEEREVLSAQMFNHLKRGHGILNVANKEVAFVHNVFREVLAGRWLTSSSQSELAQLALDEAWHPPIRYWAGLKALTSGGRNDISALFGEIDCVGDGNQAAIFAQAEILAEARIEAPEDLTQDLRTRLRSVSEELVSLLRLEKLDLLRRVKVGDLLAAVGDPRIAIDDVNRMTDVSAGTVQIGRDKNHGASEKKYLKVPASPQISGTLNPFRISKYEVTNGEYAAFIKTGGYDNPNYWPSQLSSKWATQDNQTLDDLAGMALDLQIHFTSEQKAGRLDQEDIKHWCQRMVRRRVPLHWGNPAFNRSNQPVVGVNWWEATAYCLWRTDISHANGWLPPSSSVRLPTEVEWEVAARAGGGNGQYPWVSGEPTDNALVSDVCKPRKLARSVAVGSFEFAPTRIPIFDLIGNVWEWTASLAGEYSADSFRQRVDMQSEGDRIARGSSWMSQETESTEVTFRSFDPPYFAYEDLGFRIVLAANEQPL